MNWRINLAYEKSDGSVNKISGRRKLKHWNVKKAAIKC